MSWSLPHLPPPNSFFQQGQKHTISNFRGGILSGGAYAPPLLKQGGHMHTVPHGCAHLWREERERRREKGRRRYIEREGEIRERGKRDKERERE